MAGLVVRLGGDAIGRHTLRARATDAAGNVQPEVPPWNRLGYGNNAVEVCTSTCDNGVRIASGAAGDTAERNPALGVASGGRGSLVGLLPAYMLWHRDGL